MISVYSLNDIAGLSLRRCLDDIIGIMASIPDCMLDIY
jgi:hypothetical protein